MVVSGGGWRLRGYGGAGAARFGATQGYLGVECPRQPVVCYEVTAMTFLNSSWRKAWSCQGGEIEACVPGVPALVSSCLLVATATEEKSLLLMSPPMGR